MNLVWWFVLPIIYILTWKIGSRADTRIEVFLLTFIFIVPVLVSWLSEKRLPGDRRSRLVIFYDRTIETGILLLVAIVPWILDTRANDAIFIKTLFVQVIVFTIAIVWLLKIIEEGRFRLVKSPVTIPMLAFFWWCIITFITSPFKYASLEELYRFVSYFLIFFIVVNNIKRRDQVFRIITTFMITSGITAIYGIFQHYGYDFVSWQSQARIPSSLGNPNFFSGYLCIATPVAIGMLFSSKSLFNRACYAILSFLLLLALFWSQTRGGMAAIPLGILFLFWLKLRAKGVKGALADKRLVLAGVAVLVMIGIGTAYLFLSPKMSYIKHRILSIPKFGTSLLKESPRFVLHRTPYPEVVPAGWVEYKDNRELLEGKGVYRNELDGTAGVRVTIWTGCWRMGMENAFAMIFGHGLGVMQQAFPPHRPPYYRFKTVSHNTRHAHSEYFEILGEQGWVGLALFFWIAFAFFHKKVRHFRTPDRWKQNLLYGSLAAVFAHFFENLGSVNLRWTASAPFFWLMIGMTVVVIRLPDKPDVDISTTKAEGLKSKSKDRKQKKKQKKQMQPVEKGRQIPPELKALVYIAAFVLMIFLYIQIVNPFLADMHLRNGVLQRDASQYWDRAISEYKKALKCEPTNIEVPYKMAYIYAQRKDWMEALKVYLGIVRLAPNYTQIHYNLGITYYNLGRIDLAIPEFEKTVRLDWSNSVAFFMGGVCYAAIKEWEKALSAFDKAIISKSYAGPHKVGHKYPAAHLNKGNIYYRLGRIQEAAKEYETVLKINPRNADAAQKLQWIRQGRPVKWE